MKPWKLPFAATLITLALAPAQADLVLPTVPAEVPGAPPPTAQRMADEWVLMRVVQVQRDGPQVRAVGVVLREFVTQSDLKIGDVIYVDYTFRPPSPDQLTEGRTPYVGFGSTPPLLTGGEVTYGFLRQVGQWRYAPAAGAWSFAPPVGLWPEVVASLRMDFTEGGQQTVPVAVAQAPQAAAQPEPAAAATAAPTQPEDVTSPQAVTVFLEGRAESYVRVSAPREDRVVYEGRLRPSTYVGVTGIPPLEVESDDYTAFTIELPNRQAVQPYPGSDYGLVRVPVETALVAPAPVLDLGPPPPVFTSEPSSAAPPIPGLPPPAAGSPIPGLPPPAAAPPLREETPRALTFEALRLRQEAPPMEAVDAEPIAAPAPVADVAVQPEAAPLREEAPRELTFEAMAERRQAQEATPETAPPPRALTFEGLLLRREAATAKAEEEADAQPASRKEAASTPKGSDDPTKGPRAKQPPAE